MSVDGKWRSPEEAPEDVTLLTWKEYSGIFKSWENNRCFDISYLHKGHWLGAGTVLAWTYLPEPPEDENE